MKRGYVINRLKGYSVRSHYWIPQPNGGLLFETEDPDVQTLIESLPDFGALIIPRETADEIAAAKAVEQPVESFEYPPLEEEPGPIAVQGARGTASSKSQRTGKIINPGAKE